MSEIKFSTEQKNELIAKLQRYFDDELSIELGQFDADFLLDFIGKHIGNHFYNQGLYDAQQLITSKTEQINDAIYELEKPTR